MPVDLADLIAQFWRLIAMGGGLAAREPVTVIVPPGNPGFPWPALVTALAAIGAAVVAVRQFSLGRYYDRSDRRRDRANEVLADSLAAAFSARSALVGASYQVMSRRKLSDKEAPAGEIEAAMERVVQVDHAFLTAWHTLVDIQARARQAFAVDAPEYVALARLVQVLSDGFQTISEPNDKLKLSESRENDVAALNHANAELSLYESTVEAHARHIGARPTWRRLWSLK